MSNLWITPEELGDYAETEFAYEAAKAASNVLWALSGRKFSGTTTVTELYVCAARAYRYGASTRNYRAELINGGVYNIQSDTIDFYNDITSDGISPSSRLHLRGTPVTKVHTVRNRAGQVIDPSKYYLVDHSVLQAQPGVAWGPCNLEITYSYGTEPPTMGKMAARTLAMEFCKLWNGDDDCALPQRVTSISRQGVSYTLLDSQDFLQEMRVGIYAVDLFLKSVNPDKARARARVFSPDVARARRVVAKPIKLAQTDLDIDVTPGTGNSGSAEVTLESINAEFLVEELGWTPYIVLRNYTGITTLQIDDAVEITNSDTEVKVTITYDNAVKIIGKYDPGTYDLYASRTNGPTTETVYIASGNVKVALASTTITAYTIG